VIDVQATTGPTYVSGDTGPVGILDVGETWVYEATYEITQADLDAGSFTNTATASGDADTNGDGTGDSPVNDTDNETVNADQSAGLTIVKTQTSGPDPVTAAGDLLEYEIVVTNTGNQTLTNVTVSDQLPDGTAGTLSGPVESISTDGELNVGETWTYTISYTVSQDDIDAGTALVNTASVVTDEIAGPTEDTAETQVVQTPSVSISKALEPAGQTYDSAGDIITYRITLLNDGNVTVYNPTVIDTLATTGPTYLSGDTDTDDILDVGETWLYEVTYEITQADLDTGSFTNTATGSGDADTNGDGVGDTALEETDSETVTATQNADIEIVKSSTTDPNTYSQVGDVLTYDLVVTNTGSVTLTNIEVSDPQATVTGSPVASLEPGASAILTASYTILQADVDAGKFTNTASATGNYTDGNGDAQSVSDEDSETVTATQDADIEIVKSSTTDPNTYSQVGDVLTYDLVVTNTGSVTLTNIEVSDPQAEVTGSPVLILLPGASVTLTANYTVTQADVDGGEFTNTATATGNYIDGIGDAQSVSDDDSETVTATQNADIEIVKSSTTDPNTYNQVGDVLTYDLVVTNTGSVTLTNIEVSDPQAEVTGSPVANLGPGASATLTASYTVLQADVDAGEFTNTASATGNYTDGNGDTQSVSDDDSETVTATLNADIEIVKSSTTDPNTYSQVGDVLTYDLVVTNTGSVTLTNIEVSDPQATVTGSPVASLEPGASAILTASYTILQADVDAGDFTNTATATGNYTDGTAIHKA
jgi:uncharacterized repeat protein (TIGR01451 family)